MVVCANGIIFEEEIVLYFRDLKETCIYNWASMTRASLLDPRHRVTSRKTVTAR